jgi:tetratricopeptide (TPR) repeat protein
MTMCMGETRSTRVSRVEFVAAVLLVALLVGTALAVAESIAEPQLRQPQLALHTIQQQALEAYERTDYTQALGLYRQLWEQAEQMQRFAQPAPDSWQALYNRNVDDAALAGLEGVASCLSSLGEFEQAQALYQQELVRLEAIGDAVRLATLHNRLGFVSQQLGQFEPALREFNTALGQAGKAARDIEAAFAQEGGDLAAVLRLINALTTVRSNMMNAAAALYQLGRYEEVVSLYDREDWQRCGRIFTHAVDGLPAGSADMLGQALRLANLTSNIRVLSDRGVAYHAIAAETGEAATYQKAAELLQEAVRLARQLPDHHTLLLIATLGHLGYAWEGLRRYPEALAAHAEALRLARLLL